MLFICTDWLSCKLILSAITLLTGLLLCWYINYYACLKPALLKLLFITTHDQYSSLYAAIFKGFTR